MIFDLTIYFSPFFSQDRNVVVVLDDITSTDQLNLFNNLSGDVIVLVTTRSNNVLENFTKFENVKFLFNDSEEWASLFLKELCGENGNNVSLDDFKQAAKVFGNLPVLMNLFATICRTSPTPISELLSSINNNQNDSLKKNQEINKVLGIDLFNRIVREAKMLSQLKEEVWMTVLRVIALFPASHQIPYEIYGYINQSVC